MSVETIGKYEIRGRLGAGAMGQVLDAFDPVIERRAALKLLPKPAADDAEGAENLARFKREAQAAGRLNHPNLVAVYDYGEDDTRAWIAMELVEGGTLRQVLDRGARLTMPHILRLMEQVLAGLDYSHKRGVVHRDIKPANIMLTEDGTAKIADFGIARIENSSMTQVGTVMGTPSYMAPEQLRGEAVDHRADIWACGVLLYQLLTGEKPFDGGFSALLHKAVHTEPPPPSTLSVTAPRGMDAVVSRALAKRPEDRFATAGEFAAAMRAALAGPSVADPDATLVAPRPAAPPAAVPPKPARSRAGPIAGGGAALVAAGAAAFILLQPRPAEPPAPPIEMALSQPAAPASEPARAEAPAGPAPGTPSPLVPSSPVPAPIPRPAAVPMLVPAPSPPTPATPSGSVSSPVPTPPEASPLPPMVPGASLPAFAPTAPTAAALPPAASTAAVAPPAPAAPAPPDPALGPAAPAPATDAPARPTPAASAEPTTARTPMADPGPSAPGSAPSAQAPRPPVPVTLQAAPDAKAATPGPPEPQQLALAQPARLDFRAAAAAAAGAPACGLLAANGTDFDLSVEGVVRAADADAVRRALSQRNVPPAAARLSVQTFDGPYCPALDTLRPVLAAAGAAPRASLLAAAPLRDGELLRFDVSMPSWPGLLHVAYLMRSGEVAHLVTGAAHPAGANVRLGDPRAGFPGWEVSEPFGTDLLVAIVSDGPLFAAPRPTVEPQAAYLAALGEAVRAARSAGRRVVARPLVVETAPK